MNSPEVREGHGDFNVFSVASDAMAARTAREASQEKENSLDQELSLIAQEAIEALYLLKSLTHITPNESETKIFRELFGTKSVDLGAIAAQHESAGTIINLENLDKESLTEVFKRIRQVHSNASFISANKTYYIQLN
ncbi:hypothetical protein SDC9_140739 [bioreactor metagenome]|jgi:hypothetical protein|uniref:Uncharacterized protein n=1 Tax=bioreactor metagenome TaxID=1076179 RepID=A0A645DWD4_9ZZZZ